MITTVTAPTMRAVTLEEARQQLRLDARDEDLLLAVQLDAAQAELERSADVRLCPQTLAMSIEDWPSEIMVPIRPVTVASMTYTSAAGGAVTLLEPDYVVRVRHGFTRIRPAFGKSWPALGPDAVITITLSAGFAEGDPELTIARAAILVKAASLFQNREGGPCLAFDTLVGRPALANQSRRFSRFRRLTHHSWQP